MKKLIYSVEDDKDIAYIIKIALENANYEVKSFDNGEDFLNEFNKVKPITCPQYGSVAPFGLSNQKIICLFAN